MNIMRVVCYLTTSLQSPSVDNRKYSSAGRLSHNSSTEGSSLSSSLCLFTLTSEHTAGTEEKEIFVKSFSPTLEEKGPM